MLSVTTAMSRSAGRVNGSRFRSQPDRNSRSRRKIRDLSLLRKKCSRVLTAQKEEIKTDPEMENEYHVLRSILGEEKLGATEDSQLPAFSSSQHYWNTGPGFTAMRSGQLPMIFLSRNAWGCMQSFWYIIYR